MWAVPKVADLSAGSEVVDTALTTIEQGGVLNRCSRDHVADPDPKDPPAHRVQRLAVHGEPSPAAIVLCTPPGEIAARRGDAAAEVGDRRSVRRPGMEAAPEGALAQAGTGHA